MVGVDALLQGDHEGVKIDEGLASPQHAGLFGLN